MELTDPTLGSNLSREEVAKCIHIGLLCIQEDASRRPRMACVVAALNGDAISLPSPTAPHFFLPREFDGIQDSETGGFTGTNDITLLEPR